MEQKQSDSGLIKTLVKKGPKPFKKEYDDYLAEKYADPEGGIGNAYAAAQSVAADLLIPDSAEEAALAVLPVGRLGKAGKMVAKESGLLRRLESKMPVVEKTIERKFSPSAAVKELQEQMQSAASRGTREGDVEARKLLEDIRKLRDSEMK